MSSPNSDSYDSHARKRVGKACDRCRLKKSKCDGASPCSRCKIDNAICVFGERKKSHDRVYPKGYVEMLEQQQSQVVSGLRHTYRMLLEKGQWPGAPLKEHDGHPLTHDILERLGVLHGHAEDSTHDKYFEDDLHKLEADLAQKNGVSISRQRKHSPPSDDDEPELDHSDSQHSPPTRNSSFSTSYSRKRSPSTPLSPPRHTLRKPNAKFLEAMSNKMSMDYSESMPQPVAQLQSPQVISSPDLGMMNLQWSFPDDSTSTYDALPTSTYFAPGLVTIPNNNSFSFGFDEDYNVFTHSGLHQPTAY